MKTLQIETKKAREIIDITDKVNDLVKNQKGLVNLFLTHTTAALTTADLDPGTDLDMLDAFEKLIPKLQWRHPHDPNHVPEHILSSLIGTSLTLPINEEKLVLGTWQRVILIEFSGPRQRQILASFS